MNAQKHRQSKGSRNAAVDRRHGAGSAQFNNGYRTAGGPDYRSTDWQTSEHPRGRRGMERT